MSSVSAAGTASASRYARAVWPVASLIIIVGALVLATTLSASATWDSIVTTMLINMIVVVGLYVFVGLSGVMSFGHIGFMAIGAYVTAWLTMAEPLKHVLLPGLPSFVAATELPSWAAVLAAAAVCGVVAAMLAVPLMRLSGIQAGIATVCLLVIVNVVVGNANDYTRGQRTLTGVPLNTTLAGAFVCAAIAIAVAFLFQSSGAGARLRASRDDAYAAQSVGVSIRRERTIAFVLSAMFVGAAGGLYAQLLGSLSPNAFYLNLTVITTAMLVVGGLFSLAGAVTGTIAISLLIEGLRRVESQGVDVFGVGFHAPVGTQQVALALAMLVVLIRRPRGLTNGKEIPWPTVRRLRKQTGPLQSPVTSRES